MKRYAVKMLTEGKRKFYYILDNETYDIVLYPSKFLEAQNRCKPLSEHCKANGLCTVLLHGIPQSAGCGA